MTKDELDRLLLVERFQPLPAAPRTSPREVENVAWDDSEVSVARRNRSLNEALSGFDVPTSGPVYPVRKTKEAS